MENTINKYKFEKSLAVPSELNTRKVYVRDNGAAWWQGSKGVKS